MEATGAPEREPEVLRYLATIRRHRWLILMTVAVVIGTTAYLSFRQVPLYTSTARVLVQPLGSPGLVVLPPVNLDTQSGLVRSLAVAELVAEDAETGGDPAALLGSLDVRVEPNTEILSVSYTDADPARAQRLAQSFADSYLEFRRTQAIEAASAEVDTVKDQISLIRTKLTQLHHQVAQADSPGRQSALAGMQTTLSTRLGLLQEQLAGLDLSKLETGGGEVVEAAALPTSPSSPDHTRDLVIALLLGTALGIGVALLRDVVDTRLRGRRDLERQLRAPVLATIPSVDSWKRGAAEKLVTIEEPASPAGEAYRALRTNLQFVASEQGLGILAVTSPYQGEGKTTTTANLAVTLCQAGSLVVVVSCDLRKPRLHRFFGLSNDVGVTDVLRGEREAMDVVQRPDVENLALLASGPVPHNPAELLGSVRMTELLDELRAVADFVIIDTPPLLAVADAMVVGPKTDGVLIIVDALSTSRGAAEYAREQIEQVGGTVIGGVFNNFDPARAQRYGQEYHSYYGAYRYREAAGPAAVPDPDPEPDGVSGGGDESGGVTGGGDSPAAAASSAERPSDG